MNTDRHELRQTNNIKLRAESKNRNRILYHEGHEDLEGNQNDDGKFWDARKRFLHL
jgi:hypothetical protein